MSTTLEETFLSDLSIGILQSNENLDICCPDCVDDGFKHYVLASAEIFANFATVTNEFDSPPVDLNCCVHAKGSISTLSALAGAVRLDNDIIYCSSNFISCTNTLLNSLTPSDYSLVLNTGIVEYGSLSGESQLCAINDFINYSIANDPINPNSKGQILKNILDAGIIISCYDEEIIIANYEEWLIWYTQITTPITPP